jgi:hypothetical protein
MYMICFLQVKIISLQGVKVDMTIEFEMVKDIGMMHYFLDLEVSQRLVDIFFGQGKYAVEIMKRFYIEDCKPMATPIISNIKKMTTSYSDLVGLTLYR